MFVSWLFVLSNLAFQVFFCLFFGGSWGFVALALVFVGFLAAWELPRLLRALS